MKWHRPLALAITNSSDLQEIVNQKSTRRHVVFVMMADAYFNAGLIVLYLFAADDYLTSSRTDDSPNLDIQFVEALYIMLFYFVLREVLQLATVRALYFVDFWNLVDIARIVLMLASILMMEFRPSQLSQIEAIIIATTASIFVSLISFLRATFLPFSKFVSGVLNVSENELPRLEDRRLEFVKILKSLSCPFV